MTGRERRRAARTLTGGEGYRICRRLYRAAVRAVDPRSATIRALQRQGDILTIADTAIDLRGVRNLFVIGYGKAAASMAQGVEAVLGDRITAGVVVTKDDHTQPTAQVAVHEAAHPVPDAAGADATAMILASIANVTADDLVICLISGGGSALFEQPVDGVTLADMQETTQQMLQAGAPITALNTVRKHLSAVKGGQLARRVNPATLVALILSDVVGDPLDVIASGPTVPDPTTFADALRTLDAYGVGATVPAAVRAYLDAGARGAQPETPKEGDPCFVRTRTLIVANAGMALAAAARAAEAMGLETRIVSDSLEGEAREVARYWAGVACQTREDTESRARSYCLLAGGETTVTVRGEGIGGRNSEFTLAAALALGGVEGIVVASLATDGGDGPTDAAGAIASAAMLSAAEAGGVDPRDALDRNDSYSFFAQAGGLFRPGPTGTNVNDLMIALIE